MIFRMPIRVFPCEGPRKLKILEPPYGRGGHHDTSGLPDPELHLSRHRQRPALRAIAAQAVEAESSGFDTVLLMDHFYQLPMLGDPTNEMLGVLHRAGRPGAAPSRVRLSSLVTGNTYRNPTLLAKTVTALDIVSGGRAQLGIGAGWYEARACLARLRVRHLHRPLRRLEEALQIILPMLRGEQPTLDGSWYSVRDAVNSRPRSGGSRMIGGGGERKTLRMVAQYADESNIICGLDEIPALAALAEHCERLRRDRSEITVSYQTSACIAPTHEQAVAEMDATIERIPQLARRATAIVGSPEEVAAVYERILATGVDGVTVNLPCNGHIEGRVALLGQTLAPLIAG